MARKTASRLDKRKEAEAAEARESKADKKKKRKTKAASKTTTRRTKTKEPQRKRLIWGIFSGTMKEEARFPYDQRKEAEAKLEQLRAKSSKRLYFIQPIKELIVEAPPEEEQAAEK